MKTRQGYGLQKRGQHLEHGADERRSDTGLQIKHRAALTTGETADSQAVRVEQEGHTGALGWDQWGHWEMLGHGT